MKPVLYRPGSKGPLVSAFALAAAIHVSALAFAPNHDLPPESANDGVVVEVFDAGPPEPIPEPPPIAETPFQPQRESPNEFIDTTEPTPRRLPKAIKPIRGTRSASAPNVIGNGKLLAISAPRPAYPYEARRHHITGSGIALLDVNPVSGSVIAARIAQSTGSPMLDRSALSAFKRWRFCNGSPPQVRIPFTFTMYGVQF